MIAAPRRSRARRELAVPSLSRRGFGLALAAIVLLAFLVTARYSGRITEWFVMTDEMQYVKLSLSIAGSGSPIPEIHGVYYPSLNQLWPLLLAPVTGLLDMPTAFRAAHVLAALVMASAAIPAALLTLELTRSRWAALTGGALAVAVPWMAMALMLMTEVVGYPAFLWAMLAMQRGLARPSPGRDLVAVAGIALAVLARTQFVLLAPLYPVLIALHELGRLPAVPRGERRPAVLAALRGHVLVLAAVALGLVALIPLALTGSLPSLLGQYAAAARGDLTPPGMARLAALHVDFIAIGIGVVPAVLGAGWALGTIVRPADKRLHAFAVLSTVVGAALVLQVASFNVRFAGGTVQTRYLFPLAPLLLLAMVACLWEPQRRRWVGPLVVAAGLTAIVGLQQYNPTTGPWFAAPETAFFEVLWGRTVQLGSWFGSHRLAVADLLEWAIPATALLLAAAIRLAPRRIVFGVVAGAVLLYGAGSSRHVLDTMSSEPNGPRPVRGGDMTGRDWIDRAVPGARVALMPVPLSDAPVPLDHSAYFSQTLWWDTELWNKTAERVYATPGIESYSTWPKPLMVADEGSGALRVSDQQRYVVAPASDVRWRLRADRVVARSGPLELLDVPRPYRMEWSTRGLGVDGAIFPRVPARIRLYGGEAPQPRTVTVVLVGLPGEHAGRRYLLRGEGRPARGQVPDGATAPATVRTCVPAGGHADVVLELPGAAPALRVRRIEARPQPDAAC